LVFIGGIAILVLLSFASFGRKNTLQYQKQYQKKSVFLPRPAYPEMNVSAVPSPAPYAAVLGLQ
jgi:hypothetical protein